MLGKLVCDTVFHMTVIGTPLTATTTKVLLLGSGELGKELALELQSLGVEVIAVDRYPNAPAMQVAHRSHVISMLDGQALDTLIRQEKPHLIVPEIEAINTDTLARLEQEGLRVIPTAKATQTTMNRKRVRRLASEELGILTSSFVFAASESEYLAAVEKIGTPCVVKPIMSSSGKGQTIIRERSDIPKGWANAFEKGRGSSEKVIIEGFVPFDYEITLLTVRHAGSSKKSMTSFCAPIGHRQVSGDYVESWQPHPMSAEVLEKAQGFAQRITGALGGWGIFGVELFVKGEEVYFNEVSPRPHDTGLVTLISQNFSEFALHARAILGLPIPSIRQRGPAASSVIKVRGESQSVSFHNLHQALSEEDTTLRLFGKPEVSGERRMGVALALGETLEEARKKAEIVSNLVDVSLN